MDKEIEILYGDNEEDFLILLDKYQHRIKLFAISKGFKGADLKDFCQEINKEIIILRTKKKPINKTFKKYILGICYNIFKEIYGVKKKEGILLKPFQEFDNMLEGNHFKYNNIEVNIDFNNVIDKLPDILSVDEINIIYLSIIEGLTYEEIGKQLGFNKNKIRDTRHHALLKIRIYYHKNEIQQYFNSKLK